MTNRRLPRSERALWAKLKPEARRMRSQPTGAEAVLWKALKDCKVGGARFRRQQVIYRFIVDFYCHEARLVVEVDGSAHDGREEEDAVRQAQLEALGYRVVRFRNERVLTDVAGVAAEIARWVAGSEGA